MEHRKELPWLLRSGVEHADCQRAADIDPGIEVAAVVGDLWADRCVPVHNVFLETLIP
jgi:hypothetical protein